MKWVGGILVIVFLAAWIWSPIPVGRADGAQYFDSGHNIQGAFADFFQAHGGEAIFGQPLTEEFILGPAIVQFFEQLVIERPLAAEPGIIRLMPIGEKLGKREPPIPRSAVPPANDDQRRYFASTGHTVCSAFLSFFEANGGAAFFGCPITELCLEDGLVVQYFQNARLEWHPGSESGQIQVGPLGKALLQKLNLPASLTKPEGPIVQPTPSPPMTSAPAVSTPLWPSPLPQESLVASTIEPPTKTPSDSAQSLHLSAAVRYPVTGRGGYQTVYVKVRSQQGERVSAAKVDLVVRSRAQVKQILTTKTDSSGRATFTFGIGQAAPGQPVLVDIQASQGGLKGTTQTYFTPAW